MADLRQRQDRSVAALPGQPVFAADLHRMRIGRADAKVLGEHGRQHDVRRDGRIAAKDAVDLASRKPRIRERKLGCAAHQVER